MDKINRRRQNIYLIFILSVALTVALNGGILKYNLDRQKSDAEVINLAGRQRMLSQRITKLLLLSEKAQLDSIALYEELEQASNDWKAAHQQLKSVNTTYKESETLDYLFAQAEPSHDHILGLAFNTLKNVGTNRFSLTDNSLLYRNERQFLSTMEQIVGEYQRLAERKLAWTERLVLWLSILTVLLLISAFFFLVVPQLKSISQRNRELSVSNRRLSDFAQIASHNLRAPVGNLKMLHSLYGKSDSPEEKELFVEKMDSATKILDTTLGVLTDALKVQSGADSEKEDITFGDVLKHTRTALEYKISEASAEIQSDFSKLPSIAYSRIYLESIFMNLISNAIKYRSPDRDLVIDVRTQHYKGKKQLIIADNGLGLNTKKHARRLFGLNKIFHKHPEAKGVGLFMVRTQVEAMGGSIDAEGEEGKFMKFTITF